MTNFCCVVPINFINFKQGKICKVIFNCGAFGKQWIVLIICRFSKNIASQQIECGSALPVLLSTTILVITVRVSPQQILTTVRTNIIVDKSPDYAEPRSICFFLPDVDRMHKWHTTVKWSISAPALNDLTLKCYCEH